MSTFPKQKRVLEGVTDRALIHNGGYSNPGTSAPEVEALQTGAAWGGRPIVGPSEEAMSVAEEMAINMTPVGPRRPPDFGRDWNDKSSGGGGGGAGGGAEPRSLARGRMTVVARLPYMPVVAGESNLITGLWIHHASVSIHGHEPLQDEYLGYFEVIAAQPLFHALQI